jgi:hypothetical protein
MKKLWNWGVGVATVYAIFAGATVGFVAFAMRQPVDLVSPEYYAEAQAHDVRQAAAERVLQLGRAFRIDLDREGRLMTIRWPAQARPESGQVRLYRPSNSLADQRIDIHPNADGVQVIPLAGLATGSWTVQCEWKTGDSLFYAEQQIVTR